MNKQNLLVLNHFGTGFPSELFWFPFAEDLGCFPFVDPEPVDCKVDSLAVLPEPVKL